MSNSVRLSENIAPHFYPVHKAIKHGEYTEFWLKGGRGSTKSSFVALEIILGIMKDPNANAMVLRKVGDTLRTSVFSTLIWAIQKLGVASFWRATVSPTELTYIPTGQKIIMKGLDDPLKMKSVKSIKGYFKFLWFEEAVEFNGIEELRNVEQSVMRGGERFVEFVTYNPPNDPAAWVNKENETPRPDRLVHSSTFKDVPPDWLGSKFIEKAEALRLSDPTAYDHEYMGLSVGRAEQIVFHGKWKELEFETPEIKEMYQNRFFFGADWGFANDPTALTRSFIRVSGGERFLYIDYESGGHGVELDDLPQLFDKIPEARCWKIYGDCSRPETVSHVSKKGFNVEAAPKWSGSVEDGIEYLRSFKTIYIHPRCKNTIEEFKKYSYKIDRHTQEVLPVLVGAWNHYIDSLRYALADYIQGNVSIFDVL